MFYVNIERELLDKEIFALCQPTQLPIHLQLLVEQEQGKRDIWERLPEDELKGANQKINRHHNKQ